jgi:His/Glu/Gln/Arg/opine family amino acid ABC transporter permease subunit
LSELWGVLGEHFPELASGFLVTVQLVGISLAIALVVGTVVAALRIAPVRPLRWIGGFYVETFRNVPLLVLLFISFAGLRRAGVEISPWVAGTASLGLYTGAYVAEALRSGTFAVGEGQVDAALSLGLTYPATLRRIVLPQAVRSVIPAIGSLVIAMIRNSAIVGVSLLALPDLLKEARIVQSRTFETNEVFFWAGVGYLILSVLATITFRYLERRFEIRR